MPSKRQLYRDLTRQREHYERVIENLHDRLANAHGTPWMPAPADSRTSPEKPEVSYTAAPEQDPIA